MTEFRDGVEFRVSGRTLAGTALRYGDVANLGTFRERFMPGAFAPIGEVALNLQHDAGRVLARTGNGLILADGPRELAIRAELSGTAELDLVRRGALNGFSVEFHATEQRSDGGVRVIDRAVLSGIALVDRGAYPESKAEVRARSGRTMRATIPADTDLACECVGAGCRVKFLMDALGEAIQEGIEEGKRTVIATYGDYKTPLASTDRGTLRASMGPDGAIVEIDLPDSDAGRAVLAASDDAGVVVRPFVDRTAAEFTTDDQGVVTYTKSPIRAFIVSSTDAREGWPEPKLEPTPARIMAEKLSKISRRRRLWL